MILLFITCTCVILMNNVANIFHGMNENTPYKELLFFLCYKLSVVLDMACSYSAGVIPAFDNKMTSHDISDNILNNTRSRGISRSTTDVLLLHRFMHAKQMSLFKSTKFKIYFLPL